MAIPTTAEHPPHASTVKETASGLWIASAVALPMALPILTILALAITGGSDSWREAFTGILLPLTVNTVLLCLGTGILSLLFGIASAWLVGFYSFPLRKPLTWLAFLPIAMPGYIVSFIYVDYLTYSGPLQATLRRTFGWKTPQDYTFPEIRSLSGAIIVMSLVLYPYIYLAGRAAFARQPINQILVARTLGRSQWDIFWKIVLPQARPALAAGLALVIMECLNDVGAMTFFGVRTYTIAIYSTWLDQGSIGGAAALATVMIAAAMSLVYLERWARTRDRLPRTQHPDTGHERQRLTGLKSWMAAAIVFTPVLLGFFVPVALLFHHGIRRFMSSSWIELGNAAGNSLMLAVIAATIAVMLAVALGHAKRRSNSAVLEGATFLANTGYAIPGTVLAIGIIVPFSLADHLINGFSQQVLGVKTGLLLSGTILVLVFAYVARFLISITGMVDAGFERIPRSIDHAASTLGRTPSGILASVHLPMLAPALFAGSLLVFVDAMKELPATLLLRPFNFETLATQVFIFASLGQIEEAALPSLVIVLAGLIPVIVLMRRFRQPHIRRFPVP